MSEEVPDDLPSCDHVDIFDKLRHSICLGFKDLKIPSWSGTNSLLSKHIKEEQLTNIFNVPLENGPASDYSAIYTALIAALGISVWSCGEDSKTVMCRSGFI